MNAPKRISKIFRLPPDLVVLLTRRSRKDYRTQTAVVELALKNYLNLKHPETPLPDPPVEPPGGQP